jgi:hypothetical protein
MVSSINSLSTSTISLLYGPSSAAQSTLPSNARTSSVQDVTGYTDDVFKAGNAIGKIIEIVSGMNAKTSTDMFSMDGAVRTDGSDGGYTLTKTGTGKGGADDQYADQAMASLKKKAAGSGPQADWARTYLDAMASGTVTEYDMSTAGVTSTMTERDTYNADGSMRGGSTSWNTKGMDQFLAQKVEIKDGVMYDKATGKHSTISQNGTVFTYSVW